MFTSDRIPVYCRIKNELKAFIAENHLRKHDRLPSEWQLAAQHAVSVGTVRRALNDLVVEKVIYRRHGKGTFVSPRIRKGRVLVIPNRTSGSWVSVDDYFAFFLGALAESNAADLAVEPVIVEQEDFLANLEDLDAVYPELAGVIFFRGFVNYEKARPALERIGIPCLFFGPNLYEGKDGALMRVYHDETAIARMIAAYLRKLDCRRVFCVTNDHSITVRRAALFRTAADRAGLSVDFGDYGELADLRELRRLAAEADAFYTPVVATGIPLVQTLERDLRLHVPEDIRLIAVDETPTAAMLSPGLTTVDLCPYENGRQCMRLMGKAVADGHFSPFGVDGAIRMVRRESC